jgi:hypothetical protein
MKSTARFLLVGLIATRCRQLREITPPAALCCTSGNPADSDPKACLVCCCMLERQ